MPVRTQKTIARFISGQWPYIAFGILILIYTYFYFFRPNQHVLTYVQFLLNAIAALAVVKYVIYTRELVKSGQQTADANRQLIETMRPLLLEEWAAQERPADEIRFVRGATEVSRALHLEDIGVPEWTYDQHCQGSRRRVLIFRPFNNGPRVVLLKRLKLEISHRGHAREISCDPDRPLMIPQNERIELHVVYDFVGQIDAKIVDIEYLDGDRIQRNWVANPWSERAYFEPESDRADQV